MTGVLLFLETTIYVNIPPGSQLPTLSHHSYPSHWWLHHSCVTHQGPPLRITVNSGDAGFHHQKTWQKTVVHWIHQISLTHFFSNSSQQLQITQFIQHFLHHLQPSQPTLTMSHGAQIRDYRDLDPSHTLPVISSVAPLRPKSMEPCVSSAALM